MLVCEYCGNDKPDVQMTHSVGAPRAAALCKRCRNAPRLVADFAAELKAQGFWLCKKCDDIHGSWDEVCPKDKPLPKMLTE